MRFDSSCSFLFLELGGYHISKRYNSLYDDLNLILFEGGSVEEVGQSEALPDLDVLDQQIALRVSEIEARDKAEQGSNLPERLKTLKQNVTLVILDFVRTGLFEKVIRTQLMFPSRFKQLLLYEG